MSAKMAEFGMEQMEQGGAQDGTIAQDARDGDNYDHDVGYQDYTNDMNQELDDIPQYPTTGETSDSKPDERQLIFENQKSDNQLIASEGNELKATNSQNEVLAEESNDSPIVFPEFDLNDFKSDAETQTEPCFGSSKRNGNKRGRPSLEEKGYKKEEIPIMKRERDRVNKANQRKRDKEKKKRNQQNSTVTIQGQFYYLMTQEQHNRALTLLEKEKKDGADGSQPNIQFLNDMLLGELLIAIP